jgi:saccharopine dehydrogenase-like NADP-dependent oxidoreductase
MSKQILVIGAGRSSSALIDYLLKNAAAEEWFITVGDVSKQTVLAKTRQHPLSKAIAFNVDNAQQRESEIAKADMVVSLLPASMHYNVAKDCVHLKKHMATASYVSKEIGGLDAAARKSGLVLLNECGLDPGLDHMSAMKIIDHIKETGGTLTSFKSYCGGLVAPESNDNPWGYKFSWNPRNVVLAGQGTAQYVEDSKYKYIPYNRLFLQTDTIEIKGYGTFEGYANRDSLLYRTPYGLENIATLFRGTLRMKGYCRAWNAFVALGLTDDTYTISHSDNLTYCELIEAYLPKGKQPTKQKFAAFLQENVDSEVMQKLEWLGIFTDKQITLNNATPAQLLQQLLEEKWKLNTHDKDLVVMQHIFEFNDSKDQPKRIIADLVVKGEDQVNTAMAKTVGLPLAIAVKLILKNKLNTRGVIIPTLKELYEPILEELKSFQVVFNETLTDNS